MSARLGVLLLAVLAMSCKANLGLEKGRAYPCTQGTAGECPEGSRCGLDGRCHSTEPGPYVCDRANGNADCEGAWLCGLDGRCHSPDVPADYSCQVDGDCVGGWRCGGEGRCVDATQDRLVSTGAPVTLTSERINPKLLTSRPDFYAVSASSNYYLMAFISGTQLTAALARTDGRQLEDISTVSIAGRTVTALAVSDMYVLVAHKQGLGIYLWSNNTPRGLQEIVNLTSVQADRLVAQTPTLVHALSPGHLQVIDLNSRSLKYDYSLPFAVTDIGQQSHTLAATPEGLYVAREVSLGGGAYYAPGPTQISKPYWAPLSPTGLTHTACGGSVSARRVTRLLPGPHSAYTRTFYYGEVSEADGGVVALARLEQQGSGGVDVGACGSNEIGLFRSTVCAPCPAGTRYRDAFVSMVTEGSQTYDRLEVRCADSTGHELTNRVNMNSLQDGGTECRTEESGGQVLASDTLAALSDEARYAHGAAGVGALFGKHGQAWLVRGYTENAVALESDRPLDALTGCSEGLFGFSLGDKTFRPFGAYPGAGFAVEGDFGDDPSSALPQGDVAGKACWLVGSQANTVFVGRLEQIKGGLTIVASTGPTTQTVPPYHAGTAGLPDGGEALLVSVGDALMATELGGTGARKLETRLSPSARSPILSFASFGPGSLRPEDGLVSGYILSESGLSTFKAVSAQRWRSDPLPAPDGTWLEVWTQGRAGRLGYADGTIVSLPSRVVVAPPVPGGRAFDFAQLCGDTFALTTGGLMRLVPPTTGPIGSWAPVSGGAALSPEALSEGYGRPPALYVTDDQLYAMGAFGEAVRYKPAACPK